MLKHIIVSHSIILNVSVPQQILNTFTDIHQRVLWKNVGWLPVRIMVTKVPLEPVSFCVFWFPSAGNHSTVAL